MNSWTLAECLTNSTIYKLSDIDTIIDSRLNVQTVIKNKIEYYNFPVSFDIETSSFVQTFGNDEKKVAIMYEWSLSFNGVVIIGRRWDEFITVCERIRDALWLSDKRRLIIWVHNLAYEFQFFCKRFTWNKVFCVDERKPVQALCDMGIEFRCSYILSGYGLANLGDQLHTYDIHKLTGDDKLDYDLIRTEKTPLTPLEIQYCVNDVQVVVAYIQELIDEWGAVTKLPLTKTGFVRNHIRDCCFNDGKPRKRSPKYKHYNELMRSLNLTPDEYKQLKRAFQGGFTHASIYHVGQVLKRVGSDDFTSSYPAVMVGKMFPMSSSEVVNVTSKTQFRDLLKKYCCVFDIQFIGLKPKVLYENYISFSRCWGVKNEVVNNGRVVSADELYTTITDVDFAVIERFYQWDKIRIGTFRKYKRGYLPTDFVKAILDLYVQKTEYKDVDGKELEYAHAKEMINSCYGMVVTDICRDTITFTDEWTETPVDIEKEIEKYNKNRNRFSWYPWGVFVTAYARANLATGILEFGDDYVYSDTDSIKSLHRERHLPYLKRYNELVTAQLEKALDYHGFPHEMIRPITKKGKPKPLGVWDSENLDGENYAYDRFKTLGAKRYMVDKQGRINITVSGLNKSVCVPYLIKKYKDPFQAFTDELYIPPEYTGKNTHTYIDEPRAGIVIDYLGVPCYYSELTAVHLGASDYSLSLADAYVRYIQTIQER